MNIEQQRSNFEAYELKKKPCASPKIMFQRFESDYLGVNEGEYVGQYVSSDMQEKWELWLAAQQQEGYVLVPVEPSLETMQKMNREFIDSEFETPKYRMQQVYKAIIEAAQE